MMSSFVLHWEIKNFFGTSEESYEVLSPVFCAENIANSQWYVHLYLNYDNAGKISIYLFRDKIDNAEEIIEIGFKLKLIKDLKHFNEFFNQNASFDKDKKSSYGFNRVLEMDDLICINKLTSFTVELHMMSQKYQGGPKIECFAETKYGGELCSYVWNITNFDSTANKDFILPLNVYLTMNLGLSDEKIIIKMKLKEESTIQSCIGAKLSLLDAKNNIIASHKDSCILQKSVDEWLFPEFIERKLLVNSATRNGSEFSLKCEFFIPNGSVSSKLKYITKNFAIKEDNSFNILRNDFKQMYISHNFSDIKFQIAEENFPAHRCVLSARSPVFHAMLSQNMLEKESGVVEVNDVEPEIFSVFLEFLYTGEVDKIDSNIAVKLLITADKYQVTPLEEKCSNFLVSNLSLTNVCEVVSVADMIGQKFLKESAVSFIKANAAHILSTSEWNKIIESNVKLASDIVKQLSLNLHWLSTSSYD